jgi:hypothetical protein
MINVHRRQNYLRSCVIVYLHWGYIFMLEELE